MDWPALLDVTLEWIDMNKDWLFQGAGVVVVVGLLGWLSSPGKPDHRIRRLQVLEPRRTVAARP